MFQVFGDVKISSRDFSRHWGHTPGGEGGVLKKVLYREAPPRGPTPYPFIYHFFQKRYPFRIPFIGKGSLFTYLLKKTYE